MTTPDYDAVIVGAGFAGVYQLYTLRKLGLHVLLIERAEDVGGTWFYNRYPGAGSDVHSFVYRYSFDKEDLESYPFKNWYLTQPEVLAYIGHVVDKHDLRKYIQFNTNFLDGSWDEEKNVWTLNSSREKGLTTRYLITAIGALAEQNIPDIKNFNVFQGDIYHTSAWPKTWDFKDKRVGVVGSGSTGTQVLTALAKEAKHVTSFQRTAQWNVPNGNRAMTREERAEIDSNWDKIWDDARNSGLAFGFPESTMPTFSVSAEERQRRFQDAWDKGNGFRFMFAVFSDTTTDEKANEAAREFVTSKINEIVKDPETRRKLIPTEHYARRPICNNGYYEVFNQENVSLVSLKETPFTELTQTGAKTSDGTEYALDVLVFATGFDAISGGLERLNLRGHSGKTIKETWDGTPTTYFGFAIPDYPNLFTISGPQHPFTNTPPQLEAQIDYITSIIEYAGQKGRVEATKEAEKEWAQLSIKIAEGSLFHKTRGWVFGDNIPGKKHNVLYWLGGLKTYREKQAEDVAKGYAGFKVVSS